MLVLERRIDQVIEVNGPASIHLLSIKGDKVKIGIQAPDTTKVLRGELQAK